jgi:hypothetical protein
MPHEGLSAATRARVRNGAKESLRQLRHRHPASDIAETVQARNVKTNRRLIMTETLQATIPAHPNWYVARFIPAEKPDEKDLIDLEPVIAWEVWRDDEAAWHASGASWVLPITIGGRQQLNWFSFLKSPDGNFIDDSGWPACDDTESALKTLRCRFDQDRRAKPGDAAA